MAIDKIIDPTEVELHRAAAWWGGEGSVRSKDRKLSVSFAQKERVVCEWFLARFGGSVFTRQPTLTHNEISYWSASGDRARDFLRSIVELLPESPRRQKQIRDALEATDGKLKTGPQPSLVCIRGHIKGVIGENCKQCAIMWKMNSRARPEVMERHRQRERERYRNNPVVAERKKASSKARWAAKKAENASGNNR